MSYVFYKILNLDICIYIDKLVLYQYNYDKTLIELINIFDKSKELIKEHNISIIDKKCEKFNRYFYSNPQFLHYIRKKKSILLILRIISYNNLILYMD